MELLVAQRTQRLLELQRREPQRAQAEPSSSAAPDGPPPGPEPPQVLVVEASAEVRLELVQGLGPDYRVLEAGDGEEGLYKAQETVPDLVMAGIILPRLDGLALCRRLKGAELTSHIPVIMLAASDAENAQIRALEAGADDFLPQPWRLPLLRARADNLLRSRRKLHELFGHEITLQPRDLAANQIDAQFLRRIIDTVESHLSDYEFDVEAMARLMAVSRRQLFRKLKAVTGCTPNALLRAMRLKRAARLLQESQMTITEIIYAVGFSDLKHFRTVFREQFGVLPGEYSRKK